MPFWQSSGPGEGTGHGARLPSESARALEALNNAGFNTNELGIFHHREGAEQGEKGLARMTGDQQPCHGHFLSHEVIRQTMGWVGERG